MKIVPTALTDSKVYPAMYVKTEFLLERRQYFLKIKKVKLEGAQIGVPAFIFFSKDGFYDFLKKISFDYGVLRVYFAVDEHNVLTVVFAVAQPGDKDQEYYYIENGDFIVLNTARAQGWIDHYLQVFGCLNGTYDQDSNSPTDTKCIEYQMNNILEMASEIKHQEDDNKYIIKGVRIWFSSYTDTDRDPNYDPKPPKPWKGIIQKRMITQFVLVYDNGGTDDILYIDTVGEVRSLPNRLPNFDTGNICPPRCQGMYP